MKLTTAIATILPLIQTSEAIYLACCQTTKECPQYYNTIETFAEGKYTINACCYPDEEARTKDLPECVHPIMTEDGVGISVMALPSVKLEGSNETTPQLLEEITITEGNEQISIAVTSLEEASTTHEAASTEDKDQEVVIEHTSLKPSSTEEEASAPSDEAESEPYGCCAVASTVQSLRAASKSGSICAKGQHHVDNFTINLALLEGAKTNMQVCCDAVTKAEDVNVSLVRPCANHVKVEHAHAEENKDDVEQDESEANALNVEDGSNSASGFSSAAVGIAALCVVAQAVL